MLPSTGLFKELVCPYYEKTSCLRPYCHFKHVLVRKDDQQPASTNSAVPEYKPKLLTLPPLTTTKSRKPQLEYQPEKPSLNASPTKKPKPSQVDGPVYIPAPTPKSGSNSNESNDIHLIDDDSETQFSQTNDITDCEDKKEDVCNNKDVSEDGPPNEQLIIKSENDEEICSKQQSKSEQIISSSSRRTSTHSSNESKTKHKTENENHAEQKSNHESEKRRDRHKDRDHHKEKDRRKDKDKERDKEREKQRDKESSKSSSSRHKSSSSSSSRSSDRHKSASSTSSSSKRKSSSSSSSSSRHHSHPHSSSSSSSTSRHKSSTSTSTSSSSTTHTKEKSDIAARTSKVADAHLDSFDFNNETAALFATTEEDIMKECEMIYDQLEEEFAALHQNDGNANADNAAQAITKRKLSNEGEEDATGLTTHKKRVAYENADKFKSQTPLLLRKPNHIRNAMQAIFQRQTELKRKQEEDATAAEAKLREAEDKVREANEELRKAREKTLTPLIPRSYLSAPIRPISRPIAPVANILALERAKKKVEELKAEKKPAFTPAQTRKGTTRVAHVATAATSSTQADVLKQKPPVLEANSSKISFNLRMQHYEIMAKHCMAIYPDIADAWDRAQTEELAVFKKCNTPVIYKSSALLTINKLRKEATDSGNKPADNSRIVSHEVILAGKLAQNTSWSVQKKIKTDASGSGEPFDKLPGDKAFNMVFDLRLTDEQLISNGFPRPGKRSGTATITNSRPMRRPNETERYCSRCGKVFNLDMYEQVCVDECIYHPKSTGYRRGFADNQHRCCQQPAGTPGCTYGNYHVTDYIDSDNLTGFVTTIAKDDDYVSTKKDIYALDCEMCYTTQGIELTRVTVVDINSRTVYDALVKPCNKIVDYNTVYSGITEQMLSNETRSLRDVQAILMSMFHSKTILVGHSLESDLKALKLIHSCVVDTSVLFPHKMGPPKKRALKTLCIENLKRIIQENESGHDSAEDAEVCIQLIKYYLRNKIS